MSVRGNEENLCGKEQPESTCPICLQLFFVPVSLPCGHVFCTACLHTMAAGLDKHTCPQCQAEYDGTTATAGGVNKCGAVKDHGATTGNNNSSGQSQQESGQTGIQESADGLQTVLREPPPAQPTCHRNPMKEPKFRLASQVTELTVKLELADGVLRKRREWEAEMSAANAQLRERAGKLLDGIRDLSPSYSQTVRQLIEDKLLPGEASTRVRVSGALELTEQLRKTMLSAESLLSEGDPVVFRGDLNNLQPRIDELLGKPLAEADDSDELTFNFTQVLSKIDQMNAEFKTRLGETQRSLRSILNPSEVTFDLETAHPKLVLSEDLKTVTFSATKQAYPSSPQRFSSFLQILSSQTFFGGEHRWGVELEDSPWIIGVCYGRMLGRSGLPSALESSHSSWCLMWFENLLRAFEQSQEVPLKKTSVSRRLEIRLSFRTHRLSFYNVNASSGKTHIYTFKANWTEPVNLAYRMMSGQAKGRVTILE